jgi:hypothetical protein
VCDGTPASLLVNPWTVTTTNLRINGYNGFHPFSTEAGPTGLNYAYQTVTGSLNPAGPLNFNNAVDGGHYSLVS